MSVVLSRQVCPFFVHLRFLLHLGLTKLQVVPSNTPQQMCPAPLGTLIAAHLLLLTHIIIIKIDII